MTTLLLAIGQASVRRSDIVGGQAFVTLGGRVSIAYP